MNEPIFELPKGITVEEAGKQIAAILEAEEEDFFQLIGVDPCKIPEDLYRRCIKAYQKILTYYGKRGVLGEEAVNNVTRLMGLCDADSLPAGSDLFFEIRQLCGVRYQAAQWLKGDTEAFLGHQGEVAMVSIKQGQKAKKPPGNCQ